MLPMRVQISRVAMAAPPDIQTADALGPLIGRSGDWIRQRTGVDRRHISAVSMEQLGAEAARAAIGDGPPPDLLINASLTPLQLIPDSSVFLLGALGYSGIPAFSVHATCLSFAVALSQAAALIHAGLYRRILIVSAETGSLCRDFEEPESAALIGDGAGAALVEATPEGEDSALLAFRMATWPEGAGYAELRGLGTRNFPEAPHTRPADNRFHMRGPRLFRFTAQRFGPFLAELLGPLGLSPADIDLVVPHQASGPALDALPAFGFDPARVVNIIAEYGNCIAASLPMALAVAQAEGRLRRGDRVLLLGSGAGLSLAAALLRW
jgi:3-oxoacyl-[acyl-carrier-protein] synthase-3